MITEGIEKAVRHVLEDVYCDGETNDTTPMSEVVALHQKDILNLIRAEAINLADQIIGKDHILHSDPIGDPNSDQFNPVDKAIFDMQVAQRVKLAEYQNQPVKAEPAAPEELINPELSKNEE